MFRSRDLALVSGFAAIYIGYGYVSSVFFRQFTLSVDLFFLLAAMFAILTLVIEKFGAALLLGTVTGLILLGSPAPVVQHIAASLIANGLVFDMSLKALGRILSSARTRIVASGALGNLAMAAIGLLTLQAFGLPLSSEIWGTKLALQVFVGIVLVRDTLVGAAGALFGLSVTRRIRTTTTISKRLQT